MLILPFATQFLTDAKFVDMLIVCCYFNQSTGFLNDASNPCNENKGLITS